MQQMTAIEDAMEDDDELGSEQYVILGLTLGDNIKKKLKGW